SRRPRLHGRAGSGEVSRRPARPDQGCSGVGMDPAAFQRWLAEQKSPRVDVITGLHSASVLPGALTDSDVRPGEAVRAGGYGEDRAIYTQELFAPAGEEPRTIHLGLDVFAPAGAEIFAPVAGRVHSSRINDRLGDYGPTIIL